MRCAAPSLTVCLLALACGGQSGSGFFDASGGAASAGRASGGSSAQGGALQLGGNGGAGRPSGGGPNGGASVDGGAAGESDVAGIGGRGGAGATGAGGKVDGTGGRADAGGGGGPGPGGAPGGAGAFAGTGGQAGGGGITVAGSGGLAGNGDAGAAGRGGSAGSAPCVCSSGPCCDGCHFRPRTFQCASDEIVRSYCATNINGACPTNSYRIWRNTRDVWCSGSSPECNGYTEPLTASYDCGTSPFAEDTGDFCIGPGFGGASSTIAHCGACPSR